MNEMMNLNERDRSKLEGLSAEAKIYSEAAAMNMLQLGRVMSEAKGLVPRGGWESWVRENARMSERQAQCLMQAYARFGNVPGIEGVERSKIFKMLSLPEGSEAEFLGENDLSEMTAREVDRAVKEYRAKTDAEYAAKLEAERRKAAEEAVREKNTEADEKLAGLNRQLMEERKSRIMAQEMLERHRDISKASDEALHELSQLRSDNEELQALLAKEQRKFDSELSRKDAEIRDLEEITSGQQQDIDRLNDENYALKSAQSRGDADREVSETLSADEIVRTVRQLIGCLAPAPYMGSRFSSWSEQERQAVCEVLAALEDWQSGTRRALNTLEGVIEHG